MTNQVPNKNNTRVAFAAATVAAGMVGLAYASVPLYAIFCQTTGFGGTTQRATQAPTQSSTAEITVRFDSNVDSQLGWTFRPSQTAITVKLDEQAMAHYEAVNLTDQTITGTAVYNVTPPEAGAYFNKIQCFCFTEQTLKPGEHADLPVVFYVDPEILKDPDSKSIREITLSYTFYPAKKPAAKSASLTTN
jgi:cytochrome c oxidase assembly protein subunit 11